jgi:KDO2-lipid IV(A) lauroyltransferase
MTAPAAVARAADLPLVPVRCIARGARYELIVDEPLVLDRARDRRGAQLDLLTRLNGVYERWIRATPEQWVWYRPRWSVAACDEAGARDLRKPLASRRPRK